MTFKTSSEAIKCPKCNGTGIYNTPSSKCFACRGSGGQTMSDQMRNRTYWQYRNREGQDSVRSTPPEVTKSDANVTTGVVTSNVNPSFELFVIAKKLAVVKKITARVKAGEIEVYKKGAWVKPPKTWIAAARAQA